MKQKNSFKLFGTLGILVVTASILATTLFAPSAFADDRCEEDSSINDRCVAWNFENTVPAERRNEVGGIDGYKSLISNCKSGNPDGIARGTDEGECANAVALCLRQSVSIDTCKNADATANIAVYCNDGKGEGSSQWGDCSHMDQFNEDRYEDVDSQARDKASNTCSVSGSETDKYDQREACKDKIDPSKCGGTPQKLSGKSYNEYGYSDYQKCMDKQLKESSKNDAECKARGGVWSDWDSSGKDCYDKYSDLTNADACKKAGGKFAIVGKNGNQDRWECLDPTSQQAQCIDKKGKWNGQSCEDTEEACKARNASNTWDETTNPQTGQVSHKCSDGGNGMSQNGGNGGTGGTTNTENCGQARTNLIKCSGSGVQAIGDVLRQIIVILTILIGIAAVGGIGYAAILYASATDNASQAQNAISIIRNIVIGILVYGFMVAIVNWLVPGSVIG